MMWQKDSASMWKGRGSSISWAAMLKNTRPSRPVRLRLPLKRLRASEIAFLCDDTFDGLYLGATRETDHKRLAASAPGRTLPMTPSMRFAVPLTLWSKGWQWNALSNPRTPWSLGKSLPDGGLPMGKQQDWSRSNIKKGQRN